MSNYRRNVTQTYQFDGDSVSATFRPLTRVEFLSIQPFYEQDADGGAVFCGNLSEFLAVAGDIVRNAVKVIDGLTIEGQPVTVDSPLFDLVVSDMYFLPLVRDILSGTLAVSVVNADLKKSDKPFNATSSGQPSETVTG